MKFSYPLIKKLVPALKSKKDLIDKLNLHFFEAEDLNENALDIGIPPNRFSDAASHFGIASEISAILGVNFRIKNLELKIKNSINAKASFKVEIKDKNICPRYTAQYFENIKVAPSPKWMQDILIDCGLRPINNVVDIMNYAMLETGQPLHAFDFDKIEGAEIVVRRAKKGEKITTLEDKTYELNENILVIADNKEPLAIAGIKGGKKAEVDKNTKKIIVEAANFNGPNIYKTSKTLKFSTDASLRFSHNISPELVAIGINRAAQLLKEVVGAKSGLVIDANFTKPGRKIIKFDLERFKKFIGLDLGNKTCQEYLRRLGFKITQNSKLKTQNSFLVEVPPLRSDIETFEDLTEEVIRLYGYNKLKSQPPHIHLQPSGFEDQIVLKDKIRKVLAAAGFSEVCNYSFISEDDGEKFISVNQRTHQRESALIELENPVSNQLKYLRPSLAPHLVKNISSNFRFFDEARIFEIGKIFFKDEQEKFNEKLALGMALASKKNKQIFSELKGAIEQLFKKIGLVNYLMPEFSSPYNYLISGEVLKIESDGEIIGYLGRLGKELTGAGEGVLAEIDLDVLLKLVEEEHEYRPLPKYPSVMRDISILVEPTIRVGEIMQAIQESDLKRSPEPSRRIIEDVDLIDEYDLTQIGADNKQINADKISVNQRKYPRESAVRRSLTFRIIFQAENRTLTDKEVNKEMEKIIKMLKSRFRAIIR